MSDSQPIVIPGACKGSRKFKVVRWHKKPGDAVHRGEPLLEIETEKAVLEVESPADGILSEVAAKAGETSPVCAPVGWIAQNRDTA